jgi:hypothetical protein
MQFASFEEGYIAALSLGLQHEVIVLAGRSRDRSIGSLAVVPSDFARPLNAFSSMKARRRRRLGMDLPLNTLEALVQEDPPQTTADIVRYFYLNCVHDDIVEQSGGSGSPSRARTATQDRSKPRD